jgi:hypothetical protein
LGLLAIPVTETLSHRGAFVVCFRLCWGRAIVPWHRAAGLRARLDLGSILRLLPREEGVT